MRDRSQAVESVLAPIAAGLVVLVTLLGLIGTAIRDPRPHHIPVGVAGPARRPPRSPALSTPKPPARSRSPPMTPSSRPGPRSARGTATRWLLLAPTRSL